MRMIDADVLKEKIDSMWNGRPLSSLGARILVTIDEAPTIDADRPQGEWKRRLVDNGFNADWVCSECGYRVKTDFVSFNFCPNCGAQTKGADDEQNV